jgi:crossover junction endodeoxyribonuclease RuvC
VRFKLHNLKEGRIILGIDPGTTVMGYGLICDHDRKPELITLGIIELGKIKDHFVRLRKIFEYTTDLIERFHPDELAIESPFYGKNIQSMLKLGRALAVAVCHYYQKEPISSVTSYRNWNDYLKKNPGRII